MKYGKPNLGALILPCFKASFQSLSPTLQSSFASAYATRFLMYCSSLVPSYSNSEIRISGRFEPVYFEKVVSFTIWRKGMLNCATNTSFISRLTDRASCFFCFLAIVGSSIYTFKCISSLLLFLIYRLFSVTIPMSIGLRKIYAGQ